MRAVILACFLTLAAGVAAAAGPTVRAYPHGPLYAYPLDSVRGVQGLVVHNIAVVNTTGAPLALEAVDLELLRGGQVVERRTLAGSDLEALARRGAAVQASGMIEAVGFQFDDVLGRPAARLAATPTLAPGEGLLIASQVFSWTGKRDSLRVVARSTTAGAESATLLLPLVTTPPEPRYIFPLSGRLYIAAGPSLNTHHRWAAPEEFAFDIAKLGADGATHGGDGTRFVDYVSYGLPVRAAADGEVVKIVADQPEDPTQFRRSDESAQAYFQRIQTWQDAMMAKGSDTLPGNIVILRHPGGEYSVYAHLKPGPAPVKVGQAVKAGQTVGFLGSSGSSTEPHLHFQVCDAPSALNCVGRPVAFKDVEVPFALLPGALQSGDIVVAR